MKFNNVVFLSHWEKKAFFFSNGDFFVTIFCSAMLKQIYSCCFFSPSLTQSPFSYRKMNNIVTSSGTRRETWILLEFIAFLFLSLKKIKVKQSNPWRLNPLCLELETTWVGGPAFPDIMLLLYLVSVLLLWEYVHDDCFRVGQFSLCVCEHGCVFQSL